MGISTSIKKDRITTPIFSFLLIHSFPPRGDYDSHLHAASPVNSFGMIRFLFFYISICEREKSETHIDRTFYYIGLGCTLSGKQCVYGNFFFQLKFIYLSNGPLPKRIPNGVSFFFSGTGQIFPQGQYGVWAMYLKKAS